MCHEIGMVFSSPTLDSWAVLHSRIADVNCYTPPFKAVFLSHPTGVSVPLSVVSFGISVLWGHLQGLLHLR